MTTSTVIAWGEEWGSGPHLTRVRRTGTRR